MQLCCSWSWLHKCTGFHFAARYSLFIDFNPINLQGLIHPSLQPLSADVSQQQWSKKHSLPKSTHWGIERTMESPAFAHQFLPQSNQTAQIDSTINMSYILGEASACGWGRPQVIQCEELIFTVKQIVICKLGLSCSINTWLFKPQEE